jgi:hypothetical protein
MSSGHASIHAPVSRNVGSLLSRATKSAPRESCITPTTCRVEAAPPKPVPEPIRQTVLGGRQSLLVRLERSSCRHHATVIRWHGAGFRLYWKLTSRVRTRVGRKSTPKEVRELIFRMVVENPTWGAPRIHGELLMLGCDLCERTISRWMKRAPRDPEPAKIFLDNILLEA